MQKVYTSDAYMWCITYQDGTDVKEFDSPESVGRGFAEVDHAQVKGIHLLPLRVGSLRSHVVAIPEEATPVFFRRRSVSFDLLEDEGTDNSTVHCIGWKRGEHSLYLFIWENGSSLLTEDLQAV